MDNRIKVLIVDGSAVFRQMLAGILAQDAAIEVIATAADPYIAANKMVVQEPDIIIMDIELPRMNGLAFLKKIMAQHPIRVLILSNVAANDSELSAKALRYGAIKILPKNVVDSVTITKEAKIKFCDTIKKISKARIKKNQNFQPITVRPKLSADAVLNNVRPKNLTSTTEKIIAIGASTGGINAISTFLEALPADAPGIVIVQHMPENFTRSFAERLNGICKITVKEAEDGDIVKQGRVLIAPGNHHLLIRKRGVQYYVEVKGGPLVSRHRPSVDVLFRSAAIYAGKNCIGIIMTGMGDDGAKGMLEMKDAGAETIAQDEDSCVVFGMPKEAILLNAADKILPLKEMAGHVMASVHANRFNLKEK